MSDRKIVEVLIRFNESFDNILHDKTPEQVIVYMEEFRSQYRNRDIYFRIEPYGYDGGANIALWERREETDEEYDLRMLAEKDALQRENERKKKMKEKELKEYLRLKEKYGNITEDKA